MTIYKQTRETKSELKLFRIKLIELFILTLSAIFVLLTFTQIEYLLYPALIIVIDILLMLGSLLSDANKNKEQIEFEEDGQTLKSKVEMWQLSYEITYWEKIAIFLYGVAIILFGYLILAYR